MTSPCFGYNENKSLLQSTNMEKLCIWSNYCHQTNLPYVLTSLSGWLKNHMSLSQPIMSASKKLPTTLVFPRRGGVGWKYSLILWLAHRTAWGCCDWLKHNNKTVEYILLGISMFWARLRLTLARAVKRGLKWALRRTQNIFMLKNINCITIIVTFKGIEKIKTEKNDHETVWRMFLSPTLK